MAAAAALASAVGQSAPPRSCSDPCSGPTLQLHKPRLRGFCVDFGGCRLDALGDVLARLQPCDLVIVEGYKRDAHDKIEVRNLALNHPVLAGDDPTVVAIAATGPIESAPVPVFDRDDVAALAAFILNRARPVSESA